MKKSHKDTGDELAVTGFLISCGMLLLAIAMAIAYMVYSD